MIEFVMNLAMMDHLESSRAACFLKGKSMNYPPELSWLTELPHKLENQSLLALNFHYRTNYPLYQIQSGFVHVAIQSALYFLKNGGTHLAYLIFPSSSSSLSGSKRARCGDRQRRAGADGYSAHRCR